MSSLKFIGEHKVFETYFFEPFDFSYYNFIIRLEVSDKKIIVTIDGEGVFEKILEIFCKVYDLLFLILGGFPKRVEVLENDIKLDTRDWVRKYDTASRYIESESRLCDISLETINEKVIAKMSNVHYQTLCSVECIVCEYYSHVVTNNRIELIAHTIDGFLRHTIFYNQLLQQLKKNNPKKWKVDYIESVERLFKNFFYLHRKYNCQILDCMNLQNEHDFYEIIADTRNDFSHFLEDKKHRLIKGKDMVYFIDLIFYAERLFILKEILGITISDMQAREYMYILHDWIDELVNQRSDRIKSERYRKAAKAIEQNNYLKEIQKHNTRKEM